MPPALRRARSILGISPITSPTKASVAVPGSRGAEVVVGCGAVVVVVVVVLASSVVGAAVVVVLASSDVGGRVVGRANEVLVSPGPDERPGAASGAPPGEQAPRTTAAATSRAGPTRECTSSVYCLGRRGATVAG